MIDIMFKKYTSIFLLVVLASSCVGLNLGMIGHNMMHSMHSHEVQRDHACCAAGEGMESSGAGMMDMDHHQAEAIFVTVVLLILNIVDRVIQVVYQYQKDTWLRGILYIRQKWWQIFSIASLYKQLFSRGILHSKTY